MKRIIVITVSLVLLLTMVFAITVHADEEIITLDMITGQCSTYSVTRTCKYCYNNVATVYCVGGSSYAGDVACSISSHLPCTITQRKLGYANAYCSSCGVSYVWDSGHIDSCVHDSVLGSLSYPNLCNYGTR